MQLLDPLQWPGVRRWHHLFHGVYNWYYHQPVKFQCGSIHDQPSSYLAKNQTAEPWRWCSNINQWQPSRQPEQLCLQSSSGCCYSDINWHIGMASSVVFSLSKVWMDRPLPQKYEFTRHSLCLSCYMPLNVDLTLGRPPSREWKRPPGWSRCRWIDQIHKDNDNRPPADWRDYREVMPFHRQHLNSDEVWIRRENIIGTVLYTAVYHSCAQLYARIQSF